MAEQENQIKNKPKTSRKPRTKKTSNILNNKKTSVNKNVIIEENKPNKIEKKETKRIKVVHKVIEIDSFIKNDKISDSKNTDAKSTFNIVDQMNFSYDNRLFKKGLLLIILKNILVSIMISNIFYVQLNIDSFSFYRMTFTDASIFALKLFICLMSCEIVFILSLYGLNKLTKNELRVKRTIAALGIGQVSIIFLMIFNIFFFNVYKPLGIFIILVSILIYVLVLFNTVKISSVENDNIIFMFSLASIGTIILTLILYWPMISNNFIRIVDIMF